MAPWSSWFRSFLFWHLSRFEGLLGILRLQGIWTICFSFEEFSSINLKWLVDGKYPVHTWRSPVKNIRDHCQHSGEFTFSMNEAIVSFTNFCAYFFLLFPLKLLNIHQDHPKALCGYPHPPQTILAHLIPILFSTKLVIHLPLLGSLTW